jgi:HEAT repeat protein
VTAPRALLLVGVIAAATYTASSALTPGRSPASMLVEEDSLRAGPDSARVAKLLDALGKTDPLVCELVADQLGNFWWDGDRNGLGAFSDATPQSLEARARRAAKDSLGGRVRDPRAVALLSSNLGAADACVRRIAAKVLGRSVMPTAQLVKLLGDPSPRVREAAAFAIGIGERGEARSELEKQLDSRDGPLAAMSAWALWEIHDSASVPALIRAMRASNPLVRAGAARGLGEIKDDRALPELERALRSDSDAPVRAGAAEALSELGAESSAGSLAVALGDANAEVRYAAAGALGELHDLRKAPEALVRAAGTNDTRLTRLAAQALAEIHDPATVDVLIALLSNSDRSVRLKAVEALGEIRSPKATPGLVKALKDSNAEVRKAAAAALGEIREGS